MKNEEQDYKTLLLIDLISHIMSILLINKPNKIEWVTHIVDKWEEKKKQNAEKYIEEYAEQHHKKTGEDADVATILIEAHQQEYFQIREEVAYQVKQVVAKTLINKR